MKENLSPVWFGLNCLLYPLRRSLRTHVKLFAVGQQVSFSDWIDSSGKTTNNPRRLKACIVRSFCSEWKCKSSKTNDDPKGKRNRMNVRPIVRSSIDRCSTKRERSDISDNDSSPADGELAVIPFALASTDLEVNDWSPTNSPIDQKKVTRAVECLFSRLFRSHYRSLDERLFVLQVSTCLKCWSDEATRQTKSYGLDKRRCTLLDGFGSMIFFPETFPDESQWVRNKIRSSSFAVVMFQRQFLLQWDDHYQVRKRVRKICLVSIIPIWRSSERRCRRPDSLDCFENVSEKSNVSERFDVISPRPNGNRGWMHNY